MAARSLAQQLQASTQQTVVAVDNRAGADGLLAVQEPLRSPADGHTLFMATASSLSHLPKIRRKAGLDRLKNFKPFTTDLTFVFCLMVHASVPGRTLAEVIAHIKANPGKYSHGNANSTSNLAAAQLAAGAGLQMVEVPYKGETLPMPRRTRVMPDVPTSAEAGPPLVDIHPWGGFFVHAATPPRWRQFTSSVLGLKQPPTGVVLRA